MMNAQRQWSESVAARPGPSGPAAGTLMIMTRRSRGHVTSFKITGKVMIISAAWASGSDGAAAARLRSQAGSALSIGAGGAEPGKCPGPASRWELGTTVTAKPQEPQ